jgi:predicted HTH domain antitoxin
MEPTADFIAHIYGPYSEPAEISLAGLVSINLIEKRPSNFHLTEFGKEVSKEVVKRIPDYKLEAIKDFKLLLNDMTKNELLVFTYFSFPKKTTESGIFNEVKRKRIPASISLYKKGKISLEKAAFLSGLPISKFVKLIGV